MDSALRFLLGGLVVSLFAIIGDVLRPRVSQGCLVPRPPLHSQRSALPSGNMVVTMLRSKDAR